MTGLNLMVCLRLRIGLLSACDRAVAADVVMLGGCGVVVYSCTGGLYLYRVGHGFGFCSGCHIPV